MINYKVGKKRYKPNELGSLYVDEKTLSASEQPIIYIGGQMGHTGHIFEQTGFTFDKGHNMFNGSWFFDYPVTGAKKESYNARHFSHNLTEALKEANLHDVILMTESFGGIIGAYATKSDLVSKVIAIHSPIFGTPLANPEHVEKYKNLFNKYEKALLLAMKVIVNQEYGFQRDNYRGVHPRNIDLNKLLVVGSYLDIETEKNPLLRQTYEMIRKVTGYKSDGIVPFDPKELQRLGFNYLEEDNNINHFQANTKEHLEYVYKKTIK